jgi:hypothetical protein
MEINGFSNYLLFRNGSVLSKGNKFNKPRFLKPYKCKQTGYLMVNLFVDGKQHYTRIHRLVAEHFIPKIEGKNFIDHINRNRLDNRICNLRWVTQSENMCNQTIRQTNKSGHQYISFDKSRKKWCFQRTFNKKRIYKRFNTLEEAIAFKEQLISV